MYLGAHLGIADGLDVAAREARRIGCDSLQIFAKSPQMWKGPPISKEAADRFRAAVREVGLQRTAVHHGYLLNLGHPDASRLKQSKTTFLDELGRAELLGVDALIFHPGAHLGTGAPAAVRRVAATLNEILAARPDYRVRLLVENSAGQGTTLGSSFEELSGILTAVEDQGRVGVCLDTCHLFAAGLDFRTEEGYGELVDQLKGSIGLNAVQAFHLNDAKAPVGSHLDRHENIGRGTIGLEGFRRLVNDRRWERLPGYLETPLDARDYVRYEEDLRTLRSLLPGAASGATATTKRRGRARRPASTVK